MLNEDFMKTTEKHTYRKQFREYILVIKISPAVCHAMNDEKCKFLICKLSVDALKLELIRIFVCRKETVIMRNYHVMLSCRFHQAKPCIHPVNNHSWGMQTSGDSWMDEANVIFHCCLMTWFTKVYKGSDRETQALTRHHLIIWFCLSDFRGWAMSEEWSGK